MKEKPDSTLCNHLQDADDPTSVRVCATKITFHDEQWSFVSCV